MKQRLNFSPKPFVTRDGSVVLLWLLNLLLLVGLGLTLFFWAGLRTANQTAHQQIDQLQARQRELAGQHQNRIHELETIDVRAYREQVRQFHRIQTAYQTNWGALLDDLGLILPADVRIVSLAPSTQVNRTQEQRTEETIINLKGEARNKIAQLEFIRALQQNPVFEDVRFENEEYNRAGVAIAFEIRFSHKPGKRGGS